jgi:hypothetical protein
MLQNKPTSVVLAGIMVIILSDASIGQDAQIEEKEDPLVCYFVAHYMKDAPKIGLLSGTYSNRAAAMERAKKILSNPDVVKVEVTSNDSQHGGFSLAKDDKRKNGGQLRFLDWHQIKKNRKANEQSRIVQEWKSLGYDVTTAPEKLSLGKHFPSSSEGNTVASPDTVIKRDSDEFKSLVKEVNEGVIFKDEEKTGADRMMTYELSRKVDRLADLVGDEWTGLKLRVTEAWDEDMEHGDQSKLPAERRSTHYEARAVDITTSDNDTAKLARLAGLAIEAGFDWVWYENVNHVHASVGK